MAAAYAEPLHSVVKVHSPTLPTLLDFVEFDKFIEFDVKMFDDLTIEFADSTYYPYIELLDEDERQIASYDISSLSVAEIRLLLVNQHIHPRDTLMSIEEVDREY